MNQNTQIYFGAFFLIAGIIMLLFNKQLSHRMTKIYGSKENYKRDYRLSFIRGLILEMIAIFIGIYFLTQNL